MLWYRTAFAGCMGGKLLCGWACTLPCTQPKGNSTLQLMAAIFVDSFKRACMAAVRSVIGWGAATWRFVDTLLTSKG